MHEWVRCSTLTGVGCARLLAFCVQVLEEDNVLHVFRDGEAYVAYHENPYLDDATRNYLLKARIELTGKHRCKHMSKKTFLGQSLHGFTLERDSDFGGKATCIKFGHPTQPPIMELRGTLHAAIGEQATLGERGTRGRASTYGGSSSRPFFSFGP